MSQFDPNTPFGPDQARKFRAARANVADHEQLIGKLTERVDNHRDVINENNKRMKSWANGIDDELDDVLDTFVSHDARISTLEAQVEALVLVCKLQQLTLEGRA